MLALLDRGDAASGPTGRRRRQTAPCRATGVRSEGRSDGGDGSGGGELLQRLSELRGVGGDRGRALVGGSASSWAAS